MTTVLRCACACALVVILMSNFTHAALINGGFESPASPPDPGNFVTITPGNEAIMNFTGWTVESGSVDVVDSRAPQFGIDWGAQATKEGDQILDLSGNGNG